MIRLPQSKIFSRKRERMLIFNQVERVKQESEWDCGLACAEMVLRFKSYFHKIMKFTHIINNLNEINKKKRTITSLEFPKINLRTLVHGENIWTIDLAYLFHSFDINFTFYTTSTEVLPEYSNIVYLLLFVINLIYFY